MDRRIEGVDYVNFIAYRGDWYGCLITLSIIDSCKILSTYTDVHTACKLENRPSVAILQLQLLCLFGSGIVISSLCWTTSSVDTWKRYIKK